MNMKQLQYFLTIAQCGNISAAAKKLHISQPPLSNQMKLLEEELGVILMERGPRSIVLTEAGKVLYTRAETILDMTNATKKELSDFGRKTQGIIHLGTISSCGNTLLTRFIQPFQKLYPDVHFELYEGNTFQLIERMKEGIMDLAIARTPFAASEFSCIYLEKEPMIAAAVPEYFKGLPDDSIHMSHLKGRPLIYYRRFDELITSVFHKYNEVPEVYCKNDDARTSLMWADKGLGVAVIPLSIFPATRSKSMTYRVIDEPEMYTRICAITRKNQYLASPGRTFLEFFKATAGNANSSNDRNPL